MVDVEKNRVIVAAVVEAGLGVSEAAERFGVSRQWVHRLVARYRADGPLGLRPGSRRPRLSPNATGQSVREQILALRTQLLGDGLDAGAESIRDRLIGTGQPAPSTSTIWRILRANDLVVAQPHKRPRSSWRRFQAAAPNGCWQSDFTHWQLADGTDTEIITWLDDHSRFLLHLSAHQRITGTIVVATFTAAAETHGLPASTLTDNGMVYTTRLARGGRSGPNGLEALLADYGITQKNGGPGHPQTQGKVERFQQTLKNWLGARPYSQTLAELNNALARFTDIYNHQRPHRALHRATPAAAYAALPKAEPELAEGTRHWRVRIDTVDTTGRVSLRYAGRLRHLGIGRAHAGTKIVILIATPDVMVINRTTGEIIAEHTLDNTRNYHPKKHIGPRQKPGTDVHDVPTHL